MASTLLDKIADATPEDIKRFVDKSLDIVEQIEDILDRQGKTHKDLAVALGKSESEISKWLSGLHNLTIKTISKIETVLGEDIIITPQKCQLNYQFSQDMTHTKAPATIQLVSTNAINEIFVGDSFEDFAVRMPSKPVTEPILS